MPDAQSCRAARPGRATPSDGATPSDRSTASDRAARRRHAAEGFPLDPDLEPSDRAEPSPTHRPSTGPAHRARPGVLGAVFAGGLLGTLGRYELGLVWPSSGDRFPLATFVVNTTGAFLLGLLLTLLLERLGPTRYLRPFLATGLLGGWTTYSTFAVDTATAARAGHPGLAAGYVLATLAAGLLAAVVGIFLGRRFLVPTGEPGVPVAALAERAARAGDETPPGHGDPDR